MTKKIDSTKYLLIKEATKQFSLKGFNKSSIRSICQKVDVSIASINYHFGNKNHLINAVVSDAILNFITAIQDAQENSPDNLIDFLKAYAIDVNKLQNEVILIFREALRNESGTPLLNKNILQIQTQLNQTAQAVLSKDSRFKDLPLLPERINNFNSLIALEVIRHSLILNNEPREDLSKWLDLNLRIIFQNDD